MTGALLASAQGRTMLSLSVPTEIEHDSNPNLSVGPAPSTTFLRAMPSLTLAYVPGNDEFRLEGALTAEKSSNQQAAKDRLDPRVRAAWKHVGPRDTAEVSALLDRRALRAVGLREQVPLGVDGSRTLFALAGNWRHELDARTVAAADLQQEWERFSETSTPDFRHTAAEVRLTREQNERSGWYAALTGRSYDADDAPPPVQPATAGATRSRAYGARVGVKHWFSEALRMDANAGPLHFAAPSSRNDWQGALNLEYTAERWVAALELARTPAVNSTFGGLVVSEEARMRMRYDLDAQSRVELDAGHVREKASRSNRSLASVAWVRQWRQDWYVAVRASTQWQEGPEGSARSNRLAVSLVYTAEDL